MAKELLYFLLDFLYYKKYNGIGCRGGAYMAKMGRPKLEEVKDKTINMRVTPAEYKRIKEYAQTHNLTITQVLQKGVKKLFETS